MKRFSLMMLIASVVMFVFVACSSQMERDATKLAKRAIELEQVQKRAGDRSNLGGKPMSREELETYTKEFIEYANQMLEKYNETPEMQKEFKELVEKKIEEMK
ncbi:MAG: hypothetical protein IJR03_07540 [Bacteroidales bacterium]|nr:hypothetical protein [Bacteroidales bacterium]